MKDRDFEQASAAHTLRELRRSKGLSQEDVARCVRIRRQRYMRLEANPRDMTIAECERVAAALGMTRGELLLYVGT